MIGNLVRYAASRATQGAVDNVTRKASWGGIAVFLLVAGMTFSLIVAFWFLNGRYDAITAGSIIAGGCFVIGLVCLMMPRVLDRLEKPPKVQADSVSQTVTAVQSEVAEAVDYFGPIRVVGSAFMLGLGIARSLKR